MATELTKVSGESEKLILQIKYLVTVCQELESELDIIRYQSLQHTHQKIRTNKC